MGTHSSVLPEGSCPALRQEKDKEMKPVILALTTGDRDRKTLFSNASCN